MKKIILVKRLVLVCLSALVLTGCGASGKKIVMKADSYTPSFKASEFSRYKGKKAVLANFHNQAQNTTNWGYSSADKKISYEGTERLESHFASCFQKSFKHIGVNLVDYVHDPAYTVRTWWGVAGYRAPKGVPEFQLILTSLNDSEFKFRALVFRDGETKLDKEMSVSMAAAGTDDPAALEKRAYSLVDSAFVTILRDRDFQKVF